jgi:hypothetical protein
MRLHWIETSRGKTMKDRTRIVFVAALLLAACSSPRTGEQSAESSSHLENGDNDSKGNSSSGNASSAVPACIPNIDGLVEGAFDKSKMCGPSANVGSSQLACCAGTCQQRNGIDWYCYPDDAQSGSGPTGAPACIPAVDDLPPGPSIVESSCDPRGGIGIGGIDCCEGSTCWQDGDDWHCRHAN